MQYHNEFQKYAHKHHGMSRMHLEKYMLRTSPNLRNFTPAVIEERQMHMTQIDVFSRLMMDRIIFLGRPIDDYTANVIQAQLLFLDSTDPKRDVQLYINSPGGVVTAGLGIYDTMKYISPDVSTICTSMAASMGAILLSSGAKGKRTCLKHSRVMIHQPSGGMQGQVSDMEISYKLIKEMETELSLILSENTGKPAEQIVEDWNRDNWMQAPEAKEYGLVDEVLG